MAFPVIATFCSLAVAVLWGGNILAFYPILEITLNGETVQSWVDREIKTHDQKGKDLQLAIDQLELQKQQTPNAPGLEKQLLRAKDQLFVTQSTLFSRQKMKPWVDRWVPPIPFAPSP